MNRRRFLATALLGSLLSPTVLRAGTCQVKGAPARGSQLDRTPLRPDMLYLIGDWGARSAMQRRVAATMSSMAERDGSPLAIVSVGDNFYPNGVSSVDDPLWDSTFEQIYNQASLRVPWVAVLGNHDHRSNIQAQIDYGKRNKRWIMPARYYRHVVTGTSGATAELICLDTQQLLQRQDGWKQQMEWLEQVMQRSTSTWRMVIGHHPLRSYGHYGDTPWLVANVLPLLKTSGVHCYASGHDHDLQIVEHPDDRVVSLVTGAGGGCRSTQWGAHTRAAATNGGFARADFNMQQFRVSLISADGGIMGSHTVAAT